MTADRWWHIPRPGPDPVARIICLPHAGGGPGGYAHWARRLGEIELVLIRLPGRESRYAETPYTRVGPLVADLFAALRPLLHREYVLYGHSLGAVIGYELAQLTIEAGVRPPKRLVVSGAEAPDSPARGRRQLHRLPDDELIGQLVALGGTPQALVENPSLMRLLVPTVRADLQAAETYTWAARPPLPVPLGAFYGQGDPLVESGSVARWRRHTSAAFELTALPGGHFLAPDEETTVLRALASALREPITHRIGGQEE